MVNARGIAVFYALAAGLSLPAQPPGVPPGMPYDRHQRMQRDRMQQEKLRDAAVAEKARASGYRLTVRGAVSDFSTGKPVVSRIRVSDSRTGLVVAETRSDADGRYAVKVPHTAPLWVTSEPDGYFSLRSAIAGEDLVMYDVLKIDFSALAIPAANEGKFTIFFKPSDDRLREKDAPLLDKLAEILSASDKYVLEISGFGGRFVEQRRALAMARQRAEQLRGYIAAKNVPPQKIRVRGAYQSGGKARHDLDFRAELALVEQTARKNVTVRDAK